MIRKKRLKNNTLGYVMILPAFLLLGLLILYPLLAGMWYSFTDYTLLTKGKPNFVGLKNYIEMFTTDTEYFSVVGYTFMNALCGTLLAYVAGLGIAVLLNTKMKGRGLFRSLVLLPWVVSTSVSVANWKLILNDRYGIINHVLMKLGLIDSPLIFLGSLSLVRPTIVLISAWKSLPFMVIILLAALQGVPQDQYESAEIDGASKWQSFRYITLPSVKNVSVMCTMLMFIWSFNNYDLIALLTGGGPGKYTNTLAYYTYKMAFHSNRLGYASAISVVAMVILVGFALLRSKLSEDD